jgi:hypothetical protein
MSWVKSTPVPSQAGFSKKSRENTAVQILFRSGSDEVAAALAAAHRRPAANRSVTVIEMPIKFT